MKQNPRKAASGIRHPFLTEALHTPAAMQHVLAQALARASSFHVPLCQGRTAQQQTRLKNSSSDNVGISPSVAFISKCEQALNPNRELNSLQQALYGTVRMQTSTERSCALCTAQSLSKELRSALGSTPRDLCARKAKAAWTGCRNEASSKEWDPQPNHPTLRLTAALQTREKKGAVPRRLGRDVGGGISAREADVVGKAWPVGLLSKIHQEVLVHRQASLLCVHIDLQHDRAFPARGDGAALQTRAAPPDLSIPTHEGHPEGPPSSPRFLT